MKLTDKIYIAGHRGMVGSAIKRALESRGFKNIVTRTHKQLDLINQRKVFDFFSQEKPDYVFLAAAKVGGIHANKTYPADFMYENLAIQNNVIQSAYRNETKKLCFLGSSCIYPKIIPQPIKEEYLLSSHLESSNEAYAIAKIAGLKMCEMYRKQYGCDFISVMPCNLYGLGDNYHPDNSHVFPAIIRKLYLSMCYEQDRFDDLEIIYKREGKKYPELHSELSSMEDWLRASGIVKSPNGKVSLTLWGSGKPRREFMFSDDLADACLFLMENYSGNSHVNVGSGTDNTLAELVSVIAEPIGFKGSIAWDNIHDDGTPQKVLDISLIESMGWTPKTSLKEGVRRTLSDFINLT